MSLNIIRKIFAQDIEKALQEAREDERLKTQRDEHKLREDAISKVTCELTLELKKKESELRSFELRLLMAEERVRATETQRQEMRELSVTQRQIMSDVVHVMMDWKDRRAEEIQPFTRIEAMAIDVEKKLMKPEVKG